MVGKKSMLDIIIEIVTDLFQPLMFCGFLYLFMEKPDNRKRNVICFLLFSTVMFGILLYSSLVEYYMIINDLMFWQYWKFTLCYVCVAIFLAEYLCL